MNRRSGRITYLTARSMYARSLYRTRQRRAALIDKVLGSGLMISSASFIVYLLVR